MPGWAAVCRCDWGRREAQGKRAGMSIPTGDGKQRQCPGGGESSPEGHRGIRLQKGTESFRKKMQEQNAWGTQGMTYLGNCTYSSFDFILLIHIELSVCQALF